MGELSSYEVVGEKQTAPLNKLALVATILAGVAVVAASVLFVVNNSLKAQVASLKTENATLAKSVDDVKAAQDTNAQEIATYKSVAYMTEAAHVIEGSVVTDDFVVDRIYFNQTGGGELGSVTMDVTNQPPMALAYKGKGAYTVGDRELRAKANSLIAAAKKYYGDAPGMPKWADSTAVNLSVQNYDIGSYTDGEFMLVGEK
ncbi:hypothetical protein HPL003_24005 [Paenibacillus terrae HPL-003]|uniref:Uncharacterized protein n=1 Tax=Paenibacillus terrae (strain HPL-003) TaxID=985665 RepID=G7VSM9_PAETH|nr:hypothetical protein [Paenibacillus terrae]AET61519.1 hypothetical protein HPL003_24005 [Paenibacillus terrae HPL-003]